MTSTHRASVTIDGTEYVLPFDGEKIINTTGRVIPEGTPIYLIVSPAVEPPGYVPPDPLGEIDVGLRRPRKLIHESLADTIHESIPCGETDQTECLKCIAFAGPRTCPGAGRESTVDEQGRTR
ncbi:MAG: hypothetical protein HQ582_09190 [Planctomycetes bacterium]|nr:hypothetical protein [Planctomycetota bacterium]